MFWWYRRFEHSRKNRGTGVGNTEIDWLEPPDPPIETPESLTTFSIFFFPVDGTRKH